MALSLSWSLSIELLLSANKNILIQIEKFYYIEFHCCVFLGVDQTIIVKKNEQERGHIFILIAKEESLDSKHLGSIDSLSLQVLS